MKKVKVEMFEAEDGTQWKTEAECAKHEASTLSLAERLTKAIVEGKLIAVEGALEYSNYGRDLGALLEEAGRECAAARIAAGDRKRKAKEKSPATGPVQAVAIPAESEPSGLVADGGPKTSPLGPVDTTGIRAIHERAKHDTPRFPDSASPFPIHAAAGAE